MRKKLLLLLALLSMINILGGGRPARAEGDCPLGSGRFPGYACCFCYPDSAGINGYCYCPAAPGEHGAMECYQAGSAWYCIDIQG